MSSNQIAPNNSQTVRTAIRFHELFLCSCIAPNQALGKIVIAVAGVAALGGIWNLLGGGMPAMTVFLIGCFLCFVVVAAVHKNYQTNRAMFDALMVTISPQGITQRVEHANSEARYEWSRVGAVQRAAGVVLLSIDSQRPAWIIVPERHFASRDEARRFHRACFDYWREGQVKRHQLGHKLSRAKTRPAVKAFFALAIALIATVLTYFVARDSDVTSVCGVALMLESLALVVVLRKLDDGTQALTQANAALIANDPKKALAICDKALKQHGKNTRLLTLAGFSAYTIGEFEKGLQYCQLGVAAEPEDALACAGVAFGQREQGHLQEAFDHICKAIDLQPNIPWAYAIRANILCDWARYDEALKEVDEAERWEGTGFSAHHSRASILCCMYQLDRALDSINTAEKYCLETKRTAKETSAVVATKALIYARRRELWEARAQIERAISLDPGNPVNTGIRASIAVRSGDLGYSAQALADARELPLPIRSLFVWYCDMAIFQYKNGNVDEALQNVDMAIGTAPRAMPFAVKGAILVREGKPNEALEYLNKAIQLDPCFMLAYESRARVYDSLGDSERAEADRACYLATGFESFF